MNTRGTKPSDSDSRLLSWTDEDSETNFRSMARAPEVSRVLVVEYKGLTDIADFGAAFKYMGGYGAEGNPGPAS